MLDIFHVNALTRQLSVFLKNEEENILEQWQHKQIVVTVLKQHDIDSAFFVRHFGRRVLNYFIDVLQGKVPIGTCPAMIALLLFFRQKKIKLNEVFLCCAAFKNIVIKTVIHNKGAISEEELDILASVFDLNFSGVIDEYIRKQYCFSSYACDIHLKLKDSCIRPYPEPLPKKSVPTDKRSVVYESEYESEDIEEFQELEEEITRLSDEVSFGAFSESALHALASKLSRYGNIVLSNPAFSIVANSIIELANHLDDETNYPNIESNRSMLVIFIDSFINDLILWRKSLLESGIEDPHYFDHSLESNVGQIVQMIKTGESEGCGEGLEFF